jgi:hypothetical protein
LAINSSSINGSLVQKLVTVVILAVAFFLSAAAVIYLSLRGKEANVPNLLGKSEGEAEQLLAAEGLRLKVRTRTTDEKIQANLISEQLPNAGAAVKAGQVVHVTVSTGIEAKKEVAKAEAKPAATATPKPKPKPSPSASASPKGEKEPEKEAADKKAAGEVAGKKDEKKDEKTVSGKDPNKGEEKKPKASPSPSPKASLKPTAKPSPKKPGTN